LTPVANLNAALQRGDVRDFRFRFSVLVTAWAFGRKAIAPCLSDPGTKSRLAPWPGRTFARTRADRDNNHDPRLSVEERYGKRAEYVRRVEEAAKQLVQERYLLEEDVAPIVAAAGQHWDWTVSSGNVAQNRK
jgi:Alpha/beta hydrolase domain